MPIEWDFLGEGTYNKAYRSTDGKWVLKLQKQDDPTDTPLRSVRLWNAINRHIPPPATILETEEGMGWICPFIEGEQASDSEMSDALIEIYNNTGRIIVDATAIKNFVKTPDHQVVCVDVGLALQLERREETGFKTAIRRNSIVSLETWRDLSADFNPFFKTCEKTNPQTVKTVKALLFIKNNRPDIFNVSFLKLHPDRVALCANAYDEQDTKKAIAYLDEIRPLSLKNIKESLEVELQRYIDSRGSIDEETDAFNPSIITRWFRNETLTSKKVTAVRELMDEIKKADSLDKIDAALRTKSTPNLFASDFTSGLETTFAKCHVITEIAGNHLRDVNARAPDFKIR